MWHGVVWHCLLPRLQCLKPQLMAYTLGTTWLSAGTIVLGFCVGCWPSCSVLMFSSHGELGFVHTTVVLAFQEGSIPKGQIRVKGWAGLCFSNSCYHLSGWIRQGQVSSQCRSGWPRVVGSVFIPGHPHVCPLLVVCYVVARMIFKSVYWIWILALSTYDYR